MTWKKITTPEQDSLEEGLYILFGAVWGFPERKFDTAPVIAEYLPDEKLWKVLLGDDWYTDLYESYMYCQKIEVCSICKHRDACGGTGWLENRYPNELCRNWKEEN